MYGALTMCRTLLTAVLFAAIAAPASATVDASMQADFDRAAAYWNASPQCPDGVQVFVDQSFVAPDAAKADVGGCRMWTGDFFASTTAARRCQIVVHEWGHLIGHSHTPGLADDPLGVMVSDAMPASCAALDAPLVAAATEAAAAVARARSAVSLAWSTYDTAYIKWSTHRNSRAYCVGRASGQRHRAQRVAARRRCVARFGIVRRRPTPPATPRPN